MTLISMDGKRIPANNNGTTRDLWDIHRDFQSWSAGWRYAKRGVINDFYRLNLERVKTVNEKIQQIVFDHFQVANPDRKEGDKFIVLLNEDGSQQLREGKTMEDYYSAFNQLMNEPNTVQA